MLGLYFHNKSEAFRYALITHPAPRISLSEYLDNILEVTWIHVDLCDHLRSSILGHCTSNLQIPDREMSAIYVHFHPSSPLLTTRFSHYSFSLLAFFSPFFPAITTHTRLLYCSSGNSISPSLSSCGFDLFPCSSDLSYFFSPCGK